MSIPSPAPSRSESSRRTITVWDLPVRIFHWLLVLSFFGAFVTNWLGIRYFKYHAWCGYSIVVLVAFRIVWGLVGTYHAQFWHFIPGPRSLKNYLRTVARGQAKPYIGHNPLGAFMVMLLLSVLGVQALSGLFSNDEISNFGPFYGYISNELSLKLTGIHQTLAYWILGAIIVHIAAIIVHVKYKNEPLVQAMINGRKPVDDTHDNPVSIQSSKSILALIIVATLIGIFTWLVITAPEAAIEF